MITQHKDAKKINQYLRYGLKWSLPVAIVLLIGAYLAWSLAYWVYSRPRDAILPFADDFESADLRHWQRFGWRQLCCQHSMTVVADPQDSQGHAARFELKRGDPHVRGSARSEVRLPAAHLHSTYRYAFSIWLPDEWQADAAPALLVQWHSVTDKLLLEAGISPPLRVSAVGDQWIVENMWDSNWVSRWQGQKDEHVDGYRVLWKGPLERGRWVRWQFLVHWSWQPDGRIEIIKDGLPLMTAHGPNTYRDLIGPYMKAGLYVPRWADPAEPLRLTHRVVLMDNIEFSRH